jgi:hypothetical protein
VTPFPIETDQYFAQPELMAVLREMLARIDNWQDDAAYGICPPLGEFDRARNDVRRLMNKFKGAA